MICSAPGKVIISGEHSVVYGKHALVTAVNLRCYSDVRKSTRVRISSELGETGLDFEVHPYVSWAVKLFEEKCGKTVTPDIRIRSEIPVASGLGSSAAVTVSTLAALGLEYGFKLSREEIFELAREVELKVQGRASGVDSFVSTFGGAWLMPEKEEFKFSAKMLVISSGESSVTSEMVARVAELRELYPCVVERIFEAMDSVTLEIKRALERGDEKALHFLFGANQCMLKAIGVSTFRIDSIIAELEKLGIPAKITGAGGGGSILGLIPESLRKAEKAESINWEIERLGKCAVVTPEFEGVRQETERIR